MTISKHKSESSLKHYVSKAREKKTREMSNALAEQVLPQEDPEHNVDMSSSTETAVESKSSEILNMENVDFLELNSQEMNSMMMTVVGQTVTEIVNSWVPVRGNNNNVQEVSTKENICPKYNFTNCKIVINDYGEKNKSVFNTCSVSNFCIDSNLDLSAKMSKYYHFYPVFLCCTCYRI